MRNFKMETCLNFIVRRDSLVNIKEQVVSLFRDNIERIKPFYDVTAMNIVVLEEGEKYSPIEILNEYDDITNLSYLEGVV